MPAWLRVKSNWTDPGQALYTIEAIQQEYRIRVQKMEMAAKDAQRIFMKLKAGEASLPQEVKEKLETAYEKYLSARDWYLTDLSSLVSMILKDLTARFPGGDMGAAQNERSGAGRSEENAGQAIASVVFQN